MAIITKNWKVKQASMEQDRAREVLDEILQCEGGMSGRELDFIESMDGQRDVTWSEKQIDWLDNIYARVT